MTATRLFIGRRTLRPSLQGGHTLTDPDEPFDVDGLALVVQGQPWLCHAQALIMLHKPVGYECSRKPIQ